MPKRQPFLTTAQMAFTFDAPGLPRAADLAGLDRMIAAGVARALKEDSRSRDEIAGATSALLDEQVSKAMLDAYASEARDNFNISAGRFFALIAATQRFDILDVIASRAGVRVLVGDEITTARLGHIDRQIADLKAERLRIAAIARPIDREQR